MSDLVELNCRVAMKLFPGKALHRNGEEVRCSDRVIDYRRPHLMERLMHEIKIFTTCIEPQDVMLTTSTHVFQGKTLSEAVARAYVGH